MALSAGIVIFGLNDNFHGVVFFRLAEFVSNQIGARVHQTPEACIRVQRLPGLQVPVGSFSLWFSSNLFRWIIFAYAFNYVVFR